MLTAATSRDKGRMKEVFNITKDVAADTAIEFSRRRERTLATTELRSSSSTRSLGPGVTQPLLGMEGGPNHRYQPRQGNEDIHTKLRTRNVSDLTQKGKGTTALQLSRNLFRPESGYRRLPHQEGSGIGRK